jgi:hypothetical protein
LAPALTGLGSALTGLGSALTGLGSALTGLGSALSVPGGAYTRSGVYEIRGTSGLLNMTEILCLAEDYAPDTAPFLPLSTNLPRES